MTHTPIAYYSCSIKQSSKSPNIATFQKMEKENNFCFNEIILTKPKLSNIATLQKMQKENNFDKTEIIQYFDFSKNGKRK